ncbi:hypothetical protein EGW08_007587 [Elysia chlorotica]|uniref:Uncharacterized protein n=1 Tax=Elysia chlorotica TaxID=188477 RepID=A0A3S1A7K9_ELYCH|nr:hypothetical protein EGW08_007587 [Elysia chlorotica]
MINESESMLESKPELKYLKRIANSNSTPETDDKYKPDDLEIASSSENPILGTEYESHSNEIEDSHENLITNYSIYIKPQYNNISHEKNITEYFDTYIERNHKNKSVLEPNASIANSTVDSNSSLDKKVPFEKEEAIFLSTQKLHPDYESYNPEQQESNLYPSHNLTDVGLWSTDSQNTPTLPTSPMVKTTSSEHVVVIKSSQKIATKIEQSTINALLTQKPNNLIPEEQLPKQNLINLIYGEQSPKQKFSNLTSGEQLIQQELPKEKSTNLDYGEQLPKQNLTNLTYEEMLQKQEFINLTSKEEMSKQKFNNLTSEAQLAKLRFNPLTDKIQMPKQKFTNVTSKEQMLNTYESENILVKMSALNGTSVKTKTKLNFMQRSMRHKVLHFT